MHDGAQLEIRWAQDVEDLRLALKLREVVFCEEQGVPRELEIDGLDEDADHLVALERATGSAVATLRLFVVGPQARIGRVAVLREWRRRGIASRLLELGLERARALGCEEARLASQLVATRVYERAGFGIASQPFEQAGITHVWMRRELR